LGVQGAEAKALVNEGSFILLNFNQGFQVRGVEFVCTNFVCVSAFSAHLGSMWYDSDIVCAEIENWWIEV